MISSGNSFSGNCLVQVGDFGKPTTWAACGPSIPSPRTYRWRCPALFSISSQPEALGSESITFMAVPFVARSNAHGSEDLCKFFTKQSRCIPKEPAHQRSRGHAQWVVRILLYYPGARQLT